MGLEEGILRLSHVPEKANSYQSSFGWVDFSSEHRNRVKTVLDLLSTPGVIDELGVGIVRDAFADYLFPGLSTIQTRAKYFLIVPRILKDYEQLLDRQRRRISLEDYLSEKEKQVRIRLVEKYGKRERLGIIGVSFGTRSDREVLRQPSSIYWAGLRAFGILKTKLSLAEFARNHSGHRPTPMMLLEETREERGDDIDADDIALSPITPLPPADDWMTRLTITLSKPEAEFLCRMITDAKPVSLLGQILMSEGSLHEFLNLHQSSSFSDMAELPFIGKLADLRLRRVVRLARLFWDILLGAHVRYNCLLQERFGETARKKMVLAEWAEWRDRMESFAWEEWDTAELWELVVANRSDIRPHTMRFVEEWISEAKRRPSSTAGFDQLVTRQERANKRARARLRPDNRDEQVSEWIGIRTLNYRLPQARRIVEDVHRAMTGKTDANAGF